jgi:hypothetical protein
MDEIRKIKKDRIWEYERLNVQNNSYRNLMKGFRDGIWGVPTKFACFRWSDKLGKCVVVQTRRFGRWEILNVLAN